MREFGALLRVYRIAWGFTQTEMAALMGLSQSAYSRIESGSQSLSLRAIARVSAKTGVSVESLVIAHFLLDEHLAAHPENPDPLQQRMREFAESCRRRFPAPIPNVAALAVLRESALRSPKDS
jgi:transcriptional regulator with XRE-family HTH domain